MAAADAFRALSGCSDACRIVFEFDVVVLGDNLVHIAADGSTLGARTGLALDAAPTPDAWLAHPHVAPLALAVKSFHDREAKDA